ncbi:radical SAM protein [Nocardia sp. CA-135398]|uniref:radical SAM protein n=1 Tax=Nocardia sp. CA-135398 TaxID=3239977 RepID=UPI003D97EE8C
MRYAATEPAAHRLRVDLADNSQRLGHDPPLVEHGLKPDIHAFNRTQLRCAEQAHHPGASKRSRTSRTASHTRLRGPTVNSHDDLPRLKPQGANVIRETTGIHKIKMLYLQLLYRCNFACKHCFHGERLQHADAFTAEQACNLMRLMQHQYGTEVVTLLGGEPFAHKDLPQVVRYAKHTLGLDVEICSNGYRVGRTLRAIAPCVDLLRISLEGVGTTNDHIRRAGSYVAALESLELAKDLGVPTGATLTVNRYNIGEVVELAGILESLGVTQLKLHQLRPVGNAVLHPDMLVTDPADYARLRLQVRDAQLGIEVVLDEDLSEDGAPVCAVPQVRGDIDRIESDPRGALTMSCKAVGKDSHAFWYDKDADQIEYRPSANDELTLAIPDVVYGHA